MARVNVNEDLVLEAQRLGRHKSMTEAATAALKEYVAQRKRLQIVELFGKVEYYPDYDYKEGRRRDMKRVPQPDA